MLDRSAEPQEQRFLRPAAGELPRRRSGSSAAGLRRRALRLLLLAAWAGAAALLARLAVGAAPLRVARVSFEGQERSDPRDLAAVARALEGRPLLSLDLDEVDRALRARCPWAAATTVRRALPDALEIALVEHRPLARVAGADRLLAAPGRLLPASPARPGDDALPELELGDAPAAGAGALRRAAELVALLGAGREPLVARVRAVDARDPDDLVLRLEDVPWEVHLGGEELVARLNRYRNAEPVLRARYDALERVDVRYRDRVVVSPVPTPRPPAAAAPVSGG